MAVSRLSAPSEPSRRRWAGVVALVFGVGLGGCPRPGGSGAVTAGAGSSSGLSDGGTSQASSTGPTSTSSPDPTEGPDDCLPNEVYRCLLDPEEKCGPGSGCVDPYDCDPLLCDDAEDWWSAKCESACGFGWSCSPSADPSLLRCTGEVQGECRSYEVYRCRLDADGGCGPGSGCVDKRDCDTLLCEDPGDPWVEDSCESACGFGWDCSPSAEPATLRCTSDPADEGCDPWDQDCPEGYKCTAWAEDGVSWYTGTRCVQVLPDAKQLGELCGFPNSSPLEGVDDCDFGLMCWNIDHETDIGTCLAFCGGTPDEATCAAGSLCSYVLRGIGLALCIYGCDPLAQDCPGDDLCLPSGESWTCVLDGSGEAGQFGDPCEFANACDPGLICLNPELVPGCQTTGCCSRLCDIDAPNTCPGEGQVCIPWYDEGMAPPGSESVGVCGLSQ